MAFSAGRRLAWDKTAMTTGSVYLHLGAHRTGTSSLQMCLHLNRDVLAAAGYDLAYPSRDGIPSGELALRLPSPRHKIKDLPQFANEATAHIASLRNKNGHFILSEENILGRMMHFYQGRFYPAAASRLQTLRQALGTESIERVCLVVRRYDELYLSAYRKRAEDNEVTPFAELKPNFLSMDRGWPEIVSLIKDILAPSDFVVVDYRARGTSKMLLSRLIDLMSDIYLEEPGRTMNQSATDTALNHLQKMYRDGRELPRREWKTVISKYASNLEDHDFASFTVAETDCMKEQYRKDLQQIARFSDIRLVT